MSHGHSLWKLISRFVSNCDVFTAHGHLLTCLCSEPKHKSRRGKLMESLSLLSRNLRARWFTTMPRSYETQTVVCEAVSVVKADEWQFVRASLVSPSDTWNDVILNSVLLMRSDWGYKRFHWAEGRKLFFRRLLLAESVFAAKGIAPWWHFTHQARAGCGVSVLYSSSLHVNSKCFLCRAFIRLELSKCFKQHTSFTCLCTPWVLCFGIDF